MSPNGCPLERPKARLTRNSGRVETNLVKCVELGAITAEESITTILPLVEKWTNQDSGRFYDRFGQVIEW